MKGKYYTIKSPVDGYRYPLYPDGLNDESKITLEVIGGSKEPVTYEIEKNILYIITPIWAVNPEYIRVKVE